MPYPTFRGWYNSVIFSISSSHHIPVIILTNLEKTADIEKTLSLGATTYLVKANYELEEIVKKIKETINKNE